MNSVRNHSYFRLDFISFDITVFNLLVILLHGVGLVADPSQIDGGEEEKRRGSVDLGLLKDVERWVLNCAVKEYLMLAGYRLTAMTFYEEVPTK